MTAGEICNRRVVVTTEDTTIVDAVALMRTHHVGDLVVVTARDAGRAPIGIVTDRDSALSIERLLRMPQLRVANVMSTPVVTSTEHDSVYDAIKRMQSHGVRRLPVVNDSGGLEGILVFDDIVELAAQELADLTTLVAKQQDRERRERAIV